MLVIALFAGALSGLVATVLVILGTWIYEFRVIRRYNAFRAHPSARRYRKRPLVSVLVQACDDQQQMQSCLTRLLADKYRKKEIIVIGTLSHAVDESWLTTLSQAKRRQVTIYKSQASLEVATATAYETKSRGELVLILRGDQLTDDQSLSRLVWHFNSLSQLGALTLKTSSPAQTPSLASLLETFYRLVNRLTLQRDAALGALSPPTKYQAGTAVRRSRPQHAKTGYASDIAIVSPYATSLSRLFRQYFVEQSQHTYRLMSDAIRRPLLEKGRYFLLASVRLAAIFIPIMLGYFTYIALSLHQPLLLFMTWMTLGALLTLAIWRDEHTGPQSKLVLSLLIPSIFMAVYAISIVLALSSIYALLRIAGAWTSSATKKTSLSS